MTPEELWAFLPRGYLFTIAIEIPILLLGLSRHHPRKRRLVSGLWLTACTYPMVVLVFPMMIDPAAERTAFLIVAETFAPLAECLLFAAAFHRGRDLPRSDRWRDLITVAVANLASFTIGEFV